MEGFLDEKEGERERVWCIFLTILLLSVRHGVDKVAIKERHLEVS